MIARAHRRYLLSTEHNTKGRRGRFHCFSAATDRGQAVQIPRPCPGSNGDTGTVIGFYRDTDSALVLLDTGDRLRVSLHDLDLP